MSATDRKRLIELPIAMRWRDLDAFNHANNSTFLTYIEEARLQWFTQVGSGWISERVAPVLAAIQVNYRRQLSWPANLVVELYCERIGNTSVTLAHRIVDGSERSTIYSDGQSVLVWIDTASGKSVALPETIRSACQ
jgi:acyl-CoA thioester hydrolase